MSETCDGDCDSCPDRDECPDSPYHDEFEELYDDEYGDEPIPDY